MAFHPRSANHTTPPVFATNLEHPIPNWFPPRAKGPWLSPRVVWLVLALKPDHGDFLGKIRVLPAETKHRQ
jgi:hypothetical protein